MPLDRGSADVLPSALNRVCDGAVTLTMGTPARRRRALRRLLNSLLGSRLSPSFLIERSWASDTAIRARGYPPCMHSMNGKVALITGAASGLGLATARLMGRAGVRLVLIDWIAERLEASFSGLSSSGITARRVVGDASDAATAEAAVRTAVSEFGGLDILFNNAGIDPLSAGSVMETSPADWDRIINVNVRSAYLFSKAAIPMMIQGGGGAIVNTASVAAIRAAPEEAAYSASKAAMIALTQSLALDYARHGIRANALCPGLLQEAMTDRRVDLTPEDRKARRALAAQMVPLGREGTYDEVACTVMFLAGSESSYITGTTLIVDGGLLLT